MACFDPNELAELIRHEFIVDDDSGRCMKILQPPARKAKPGGLPLNFRTAVDSDSSSDEHSPCYLATTDCESTYELIQERLRSRALEFDLSGTEDDDKSVKSSTVDTQPSTPDSELFQYKDVSSSPIAAQRSITTELLRQTDFIIRPDLAAYARFAASDAENGRKLLVFYPFSDSKSDRDCNERSSFSLTLYARQQIRISDLIGLCCYEYARNRRTNDIGDISLYHLLMAEESGEIDKDLPPVDGHRLLSELGSCWSTVALVRRRTFTNSSLGTTNIVVYTVSGSRYEFLVESLDVSLRWLRDQAVQKRIEDEGRDFISDCPALQEYVLETIEQRDVVLNLDMPISSTACTEFLLLRINSSRGDFTPRPYQVSTAERLSPRLQTHADSISSCLPLERPGRIDLNRKTLNATDATTSTSSLNFTDLLGSAVAVYPIERIHRYKPKWSASLTIRTDGLEIAPTQADRNKKRSPLFLTSPQKTQRLSWDRIGGVEIVDRSSAKRVIRIVWLAEPRLGETLRAGEFPGSRRDSTLSSESARSARSDETSRRMLHNDGYWKMLFLEADVNDAWDIAEKMCAIIDERNSDVRQIYKHSHGGTKKPKEAAAEAFDSATVLSLKGRSTPASPVARGMSRLTSTVAGAVPTLQKLLSKH